MSTEGFAFSYNCEPYMNVKVIQTVTDLYSLVVPIIARSLKEISL